MIMSTDDDFRQKTWWPFPVISPDRQTEQHKAEIRFLEMATAQGFRPYTFGAEHFGAVADNGREGLVLYRGRSRWEVVLIGPVNQPANSLCQDFESAGNVLLNWLRGEPADGIQANAMVGSTMPDTIGSGSTSATGDPG